MTIISQTTVGRLSWTL